MSRLLLGTFITFILCKPSYAEQTIRITEYSAQTNTMQLVRLILDATERDFGKYRFKVVDTPGQARTIEELHQNRLLDLIWLVSNKEREEKLRPIRIPIDMGLMGYRVCVIKKQDQHLFDNIHTLDDWKKSPLKIGTGTHWAEAKVLQANKLKIVTSLHFHPLFDMLSNQRFHCLSRSIIEAVDEKEQFGGDLTIEQNLLFFYPMPSFFFVNKDNHVLAQRIQLGFDRIRKSGAFKRYFKESKLDKIHSLGLGKRKIIRLHNPHLSKATIATLNDPSLWFSLNNFSSPTHSSKTHAPYISVR